MGTFLYSTAVSCTARPSSCEKLRTVSAASLSSVIGTVSPMVPEPISAVPDIGRPPEEHMSAISDIRYLRSCIREAVSGG